MSLNLCFEVKGGTGIVDFPFQTPTALTMKVLKTGTKKQRLHILKQQMEEWGWEEEQIQTILKTIKALMDSPNLELSYI